MFCGCCLNCALAWENKLVVKEAEEVLLGAAYVLKVLKWLFIHILKGYKLNYVTHVMWVVKCEIMCCLIWNQYFDHIQVNHSILVVNNGLLFLCPINPWVWLNKLSVKLAQLLLGARLGWEMTLYGYYHFKKNMTERWGFWWEVHRLNKRYCSVHWFGFIRPGF